MTRCSTFAALLLATLWAWPTAAQTPPAAAAGTDAPALLVLVSSDAWLHAAPDAKSHKFRIQRRLPSMRRTYKRAIFPLYATARPKRVLLFELAEPLPAGEGWAHLRPLDPHLQVPNGCDFLTPGRGLGVDLYVRTASLLPTLKDSFLANFEEGTGVELKPGVAIRPTKKKGLFIAETPHLQVEVPLAPDAITRTFSPQPGFSIGKAPAWAKGPVKLAISGEIRATLFGVDIGLQAEPVKRGPGRWLLTDVGSCAKVIGLGRYRPLKRDPAPGAAGVLGSAPKDALHVAAGVEVFWPDGTPAGTTGQALMFMPKEENKTGLEGKRCMNHAYFADEKQIFCFPADEVTSK